MHVTTKNEERVIHDVIGYIKGSYEPGLLFCNGLVTYPLFCRREWLVMCSLNVWVMQL